MAARDADSDRQPISRASLGIAALSTVVEWYDFTLYLYFATVLSRVFFGGGSSSLLMALGGFALTYLARPLGAIVFGHIGDRKGRRYMLLMSMALMTLAMLATALLPTHAQIGPAAGIAILLLRCLMAFSVGGEYTGVVAYLVEGSAPRRRGLIASLASASSEVGALLAVAVSAVTVSVFDEVALEQWGWRIPFLIGAALAGTIWLARSGMEESPDFERQREQGRVPAHPLRDTLRHHPGAVLRTFMISALGSITYYVGITYVPTFTTSTGAQPESASLWMSTVAAVVVILATPLFGALSDRVGRRLPLIVLTLLSIVTPLSMFAVMREGSAVQVVLAAVLLACIAGGVSAVAASATAEQFPGEGRVSGLALGVTMATAVFGGLTPWLAQLLVEQTGWAQAPGAMIAVVALLALPAMWRLPETAPALRQHGSARTEFQRGRTA